MFFVYLAEAMSKEKSFDVHITPHTDICLDEIFDDLTYPNYTLQECTASPPLRIFEAPPLFGKRVPAFSIEVHNETAPALATCIGPRALHHRRGVCAECALSHQGDLRGRYPSF